ncbi:MAG: hypothetical protein HY921_06980 [Elusimicrobia bacterium]|nr:hypothetical protein [Elusimicrobiota bacterium]
MNRKWIMAAMLSLGLTAPAGAEEAAKTEPPKDEAVKTVEPKEDADRKAGELAARYNVSKEDVKQLRDKGLGWGEIRHALGIAQEAGVPLADVMKLRDSGMGWGKIAQNYGFKLGEITGRNPEMGAREIREEGRQQRRELREQMRQRRHEGGGPNGPRGRGGAKG